MQFQYYFSGNVNASNALQWYSGEIVDACNSFYFMLFYSEHLNRYFTFLLVSYNIAISLHNILVPSLASLQTNQHNYYSKNISVII